MSSLFKFIPNLDILIHAGMLRTLEEKRKILQGKPNPTGSRVECEMPAPQDKQEVLKIMREIRFAIELAMVSPFGWLF